MGQDVVSGLVDLEWLTVGETVLVSLFVSKEVGGIKVCSLPFWPRHLLEGGTIEVSVMLDVGLPLEPSRRIGLWSNGCGCIESPSTSPVFRSGLLASWPKLDWLARVGNLLE